MENVGNVGVEESVGFLCSSFVAVSNDSAHVQGPFSAKPATIRQTAVVACYGALSEVALLRSALRWRGTAIIDGSDRGSFKKTGARHNIATAGRRAGISELTSVVGVGRIFPT